MNVWLYDQESKNKEVIHALVSTRSFEVSRLVKLFHILIDLIFLTLDPDEEVSPDSEDPEAGEEKKTQEEKVATIICKQRSQTHSTLNV